MPFSGRKIISRIKYSLSAQIFFSIVVAMTTLIVVFDFLIIQSQEKAITSFIVEEGEALSKLLADTIEIGLYSENTAIIKQSAAPVLNQPNVIGIEIFDGLGKLQFSTLASSGDKISGPESSKSKHRANAIASVTETQAPVYYQMQSSLDFWAPVHIATNSSGEDIYFQSPTSGKANNLLIGFVRIVLSKQKLSLGIKQLTGENLFALGVFLLLSTLVTFIVVRAVTRPLSGLVSMVRQQQRGKTRINDIGFLTETYTEQLLSLEKAFEKNKELKENLEDTTREIIRVQEQERRRISFDLHDHIAQDLSSLRMNCETFFDGWPEVPQNILRRKDVISLKVKECIHSVRNLSYELRPPDLDELGLTEAFYQYCTEFAEENGIELHFQSAGIENLDLDNSIEINLYRILQEALNNIKAHAHAKNLAVKLIASHPNILLRIKDDGKGFDCQNRLKEAILERHMGVQIMRERTTLFNGDFDIRSLPGRGTKVFIKIPY